MEQIIKLGDVELCFESLSSFLKRKKQPRAELPPDAFGGIYHVETGDITAFFGDPDGPVENVRHKLVKARSHNSEQE